MPEPTFGPDKCQEDKCLNPQVQAFVHRGICPLQAFVLRGICPTGGQMPVQAFVLPGICLSRHLSANLPYWYNFNYLRLSISRQNQLAHQIVICFAMLQQVLDGYGGWAVPVLKNAPTRHLTLFQNIELININNQPAVSVKHV